VAPKIRHEIAESDGRKGFGVADGSMGTRCGELFLEGGAEETGLQAT